MRDLVTRPLQARPPATVAGDKQEIAGDSREMVQGEEWRGVREECGRGDWHRPAQDATVFLKTDQSEVEGTLEDIGLVT